MLTEKAHTGGFLLNMEEGHRSVDNGTLLSGQNLTAGTVVGKITSGGKWTAYDPSSSDGSQTNLGILYASVDASAGDAPCVVVVRDCEVNGNELIYKSVSPAPVPATVATALALNHVIVR